MPDKPHGRPPLPQTTALGRWIRAARLRSKMSVPALAERAGVCSDYWYRLESGKCANPSRPVRAAVAAALGVGVSKMPKNEEKS